MGFLLNVLYLVYGVLVAPRHLTETYGDKPMSDLSLTQEYIKELLDYNPDTGVFTWKARPREMFNTTRGWNIFNAIYPGTITGSLNKISGYLIIGIDAKLYRAHRLAFLYMTGEWPKDQVDHINHDRANNRWLNLREATHQENGMNRSLSKANTSGFTGVCWREDRGKWVASIRIDGSLIHLGYFDDFDDAVAARKAAEIEHGFHENHGQ